MNRIFPKSLFTISEQESITTFEAIYLKRIIPKGLTISDYSISEKLIELEDTSTGERMWIGMKEFFKTKIIEDTCLRVQLEGEIAFTSLKEIKVTEFRKRQCLTPIYINDLPF